MMTKPISRRRNIIYGLSIIPLALFLVSCFGAYENMKPLAESYIDYINKDKFSVDFMGMNQEQLDEVQWQVSQEGIALNYVNLEFNSEKLLQNLEFSVNFNNGYRATAKISCTDAAMKPYGFWIDRNTSEYNTGFIGAQFDKKKAAFYDKMTAQKNKGAEYYIEDKKVSYDEAVIWFNQSTYWQSHVSCDNPPSGTFTFRLSSSLTGSWNPFRNKQSYPTKLSEFKTVPPSNISELPLAVDDKSNVAKYIDFKDSNSMIYLDGKEISMERAVHSPKQNKELYVTGIKNEFSLSEVRITLSI